MDIYTAPDLLSKAPPKGGKTREGGDCCDLVVFAQVKSKVPEIISSNTKNPTQK
jgi:hypothetical protein